MPRKRSERVETVDADESLDESAAGATGLDADAASEEQTREGGTGDTVTFRTGPAEWAQSAFLVGEFNDWSTDATPMERVGDHFEATVSLPSGREYRYRYLFDGQHWDNDPDADEYVPNDFGSDDSLRRC